MRRILKINGSPILNFKDLQREFSPLALYDALPVFSEFSKVHCLNFPMMIKKENGEPTVAEYYTKQFWQFVLEEGEQDVAAEGEIISIFKKLTISFFLNKLIENSIINALKEVEVYCKNNAENKKNIQEERPCIIAVRKWIKENGEDTDKDIINDKHINEIIKKEFEEQMVLWLDFVMNNAIDKKEPAEFKCFSATDFYEKLNLLTIEYKCIFLKLRETIQFIANKVDCKNKGGKVLILIAICELAEVNALTANWNTASDSVEKSDESPKDTIPIDFTFENNVPIICNSKPYRFWCFEGSELPLGETIRTVRVEGRRNGNFKKAIVELVCKSTNKCVQKIVLNAGDSVYVNAVGNSIIKALPEYSVSSDNCVIKRGDSIWVYQKNREAWTTEIKNVSSLAAGNSDEGFLIVADGKIMTHFCDLVESSYTAKLIINAIITPVVEVRKAVFGFDILLNDGEIINTHTDVKSSDVSLSSIEEDSLFGQHELVNVFGEDVKYAISKKKDKFDI